MTRPATSVRRVLAVLAVTTAVGALAGGLSLAAGWLSMGDTLTARLPFGSPVLGGVALVVLVGLPQTLAAVLVLRDDPRAAAVTLAAGAGLLAWIVVEVAFLRVVVGLQTVYLVVGVTQVLLALRLDRRTRPLSGRSSSPSPPGSGRPPPARRSMRGRARPGPRT